VGLYTEMELGAGKGVIPALMPGGLPALDAPQSMLFLCSRCLLLGQPLGHKARADEILTQYQWLGRC
jgi:hypothetical protein